MGPFVAVALLVLVGRPGLAATPDPVTPGPPTTSDAPPSPTPLAQVTTLPRTDPGSSPLPTLASHLVKARPTLRMTTRTIPAHQDAVDGPKTVMSLIGAITTSVDPKDQPPIALSTMPTAKTRAGNSQTTADNNDKSTAKLAVKTNNYSQTRTTSSYFSQSTARIMASSDNSQTSAKHPMTENVQSQGKIITTANNYSQTTTNKHSQTTANNYSQTTAEVSTSTENPIGTKARIMTTVGSLTTSESETTAKLLVTAGDPSLTTTATMSTVADGQTTAKISSTESSTEQESESVHPRFPSDLEQRLESLHCTLPPLPPKSRLWRGNQTHELNLPISTEPGGTSGWSVSAQLQSGDVLVVRIDTRSLLEPSNDTTSKFGAAVFSVPREALRRCDASQGILLDISPVMLDGQLILALYDKDLSDGDNYLEGKAFPSESDLVMYPESAMCSVAGPSSPG